LLQYGYTCISDRIVAGDLLDDADHDLLKKVCHSHHSLNHSLPPERIFINLRARYLSTLHCRIKSHLLQQHVLLFGH